MDGEAGRVGVLHFIGIRRKVEAREQAQVGTHFYGPQISHTYFIVLKFKICENPINAHIKCFSRNLEMEILIVVNRYGPSCSKHR